MTSDRGAHRRPREMDPANGSTLSFCLVLTHAARWCGEDPACRYPRRQREDAPRGCRQGARTFHREGEHNMYLGDLSLADFGTGSDFPACSSQALDAGTRLAHKGIRDRKEWHSMDPEAPRCIDLEKWCHRPRPVTRRSYDVTCFVSIVSGFGGEQLCVQSAVAQQTYTSYTLLVSSTNSCLSTVLRRNLQPRGYKGIGRRVLSEPSSISDLAWLHVHLHISIQITSPPHSIISTKALVLNLDIPDTTLDFAQWSRLSNHTTSSSSS